MVYRQMTAAAAPVPPWKLLSYHPRCHNPVKIFIYWWYL
jgi:hypothetical protein